VELARRRESSPFHPVRGGILEAPGGPPRDLAEALRPSWRPPRSSLSFAALCTSPQSRSRSKTCSLVIGGFFKAANTEPIESFLREVLDVERHDGLRARPDGRSEDMAVVRVRQGQPVHEVLVAGHHAVGMSCLVRSKAGALRSGRSRRMASKHSSRISSDHLACTIPVRASRRRKSRSGAGYSTQAS